MTNNSPIELTCRADQTVLEALVAAGAVLESPCGGLGTCGKCRVRITQCAHLPNADEDERQCLGEEMLREGWRLACRLRALGRICVELPQASANHRILAGGETPHVTPDHTFSKICCAISPRDAKDAKDARGARDAQATTAWLAQQTGVCLDHKPSLDLLQSISFLSVDQGKANNVITLLKQGDVVVRVEPGDTTASMFGFAVDVGTTTVVVSLVDLASGQILGNASAINPQTRYGLDVLSRIAFAREQGRVGVRQLSAAIVALLNNLCLDLCRQHNIDPVNTYLLCVAANTTMTHLLLGVAPHSLGVAPFAPVFVASQQVTGKDIGLRAFPATQVHTLPAVSAYIGSDVVAGTYVCGMHTTQQNILFIDIGTNGEVILASRGKLVSCSCAAGPAFEGMNIQQGMRAATGAIEDLRIQLNAEQTGIDLKLKTIDDAPPVGICGSGILAAVRELLDVGLIRPDGRMLKAADLPEADPRRALCCTHLGKAAVQLAALPHQVIITQKDVRQVQLAKGAILSAFTALLQHAGLTMEDIDGVLVAGQFGAYLPAHSLTACGIVPVILKDRLSFVGNTSKTGAYMALMSQHVRNEISLLSKSISYVELNAIPGYDRLFAACMRFPD